MKEIKWKVFESANTSLSVEPSHPVIRACSRLFHASRLVTWHLGRNGLQLWIFYWPTDDIDLTSINLLKGNLCLYIIIYVYILCLLISILCTSNLQYTVLRWENRLIIRLDICLDICTRVFNYLLQFL